MTQEELHQLLFSIFKMPRIQETIVKNKSDLSDGVFLKNTRVSGVCQGAYRSIDTLEKGALVCGCPADAPSVLCSYHDERLPGEHRACLLHKKKCHRCGIDLCQTHQPPPSAPPPPYCPSCAKKTDIDLTMDTAIGWLSRLFQ